MEKDKKAVEAFVKTSLQTLNYAFSHIDEAIAATAKEYRDARIDPEGTTDTGDRNDEHP